VKLRGHANWHIWCVTRNRTSCPATTNSGYEMWIEENCNAHQRLWLALNDDTKQAVLPYAKSDASQLFGVLKSLYEPQGPTAEFYMRHTYENVKLSDHDNFDGFMTTLINAAHQFNREVADANGYIKNHNIAMRIIHALPPILSPNHPICIWKCPPSDEADWDLQALCQCITSAEDWAWATGLKLDNLPDPKALTAQDDGWKGKRNNPTWLSWQTCWVCGKVGHLHQKCTASQAEKQAYKEK